MLAFQAGPAPYFFVLMRRFLASLWFSLLACLILGVGTVAAYALLKPLGADVGNSEVVRWFTIAGWAFGPAAALLSFIGIGILNLIRRIVRARKVNVLHPVIVLVGIVPWLVFAWQITGEPPYTSFARAAIEFVGRPLLWGSLASTLFVLLCSTVLLFPSQSSKKQK